MAVSALVVEDDAFTRVTLAESLRAQGVDVVLATDRAAEALDLARQRPLHAAFLDLHLGPQTGQRDQWTASLSCDRQGKYKDWLFVTATDEEGRTARVRFDVTAAC